VRPSGIEPAALRSGDEVRASRTAGFVFQPVASSIKSCCRLSGPLLHPLLQSNPRCGLLRRNPLFLAAGPNDPANAAVYHAMMCVLMKLELRDYVQAFGFAYENGLVTGFDAQGIPPLEQHR
jgi:hypothetical protein